MVSVVCYSLAQIKLFLLEPLILMCTVPPSCFLPFFSVLHALSVFSINLCLDFSKNTLGISTGIPYIWALCVQMIMSIICLQPSILHTYMYALYVDLHVLDVYDVL